MIEEIGTVIFSRACAVDDATSGGGGGVRGLSGGFDAVSALFFRKRSSANIIAAEGVACVEVGKRTVLVGLTSASRSEINRMRSAKRERNSHTCTDRGVHSVGTCARNAHISSRNKHATE